MIQDILGAINNTIVTNATTGEPVKIMYDIPYIVNSIIIILSIKFLYDMMLQMLKLMGRREK